MSHWKSYLGIMLVSLTMAACGSDDDDATKSGNNEVCKAGGTCENYCDSEPATCNLSCPSGATCKAWCQEGQSCNFECAADAKCTFDCTAGACNATGEGADCSCTGDCTGTCGGLPGTDPGGSAGGGSSGGADCLSECGAPTDPGYAACVQACEG